MKTEFPTSHPLSPHHPPLTGLFNRQRELSAILADISRGEFAALWAPRYAGRTTLLHCLEAALSRSQGETAVYISPEDHLDPSSRDSLFRSLAAQLQARLIAPNGQQQDFEGDWSQPDALERFLRWFIEVRSLSHLTILLDDCDKLISTALVTLLRSLREIYRQRSDPRNPLRQVAFVVAGAVSFRNFKLLEQDSLSPFDDWSVTHLSDLTYHEAREYLEAGFAALDIEIETKAIEDIVKWAGGDLLRLNAISKSLLPPAAGALSVVDVSRSVHRLLGSYQADPSIMYMISVISHDPRCLEVIERTRRGDMEFERSHLNRYQDQYFGISNQELSGAFLLEREGAKPIRWALRNRFCREVLNSYFSSQRLVRAFLDLGRYDKIGHYIEQLADELASDFRDDVLRFDESAMRDIIDWFWSRSLKTDRISMGCEAFEFVLKRIFGIEDFLVFEADQDKKKLLRNEFLPSNQPTMTDGEVIELEAGKPVTREVRVFRSELYTVEIEDEQHLRVVIPLRDYTDRASGVLSFRTKRYMEPWATLFVRIPIIERAVNLIWPRLSRYESDQQAVFTNLAKGVNAEANKTTAVRGIPILISTKFNTDLYRHFKRNLARFPESFDPRLLEFKEGFILEQILKAIRAPDAFLIFDLSMINCNVQFELGLAIGLNRPGLPAYEENRRSEPELLKGLLYAIYRAGRPLRDNFFARLQERWSSYQTHREDADFVHLLNCRVPDRQPQREYALIIDHNHFRDKQVFRKAVQDAVADREIIYLWQTDDRLEVVGVEEMILTRAYRLIKEAAVVIARVERIEEDRSCSSRFVATGIAKGLEVSQRGRGKVFMVARNSQPGGEPIVVPSDLSGVGPLPFDGKSKSLTSALRRAFKARGGHIPIEDLGPTDHDPRLMRLAESLRRQGVAEVVISSAIAEMRSF